MNQRQRAQARPIGAARPMSGPVGAGRWLPAAVLLLGLTLAAIGALVVYRAVQPAPSLAVADRSDRSATPGTTATIAPPTSTPARGAPIVASRGGQSAEQAGTTAADATPPSVVDSRPPPLFQPTGPESASAPAGTSGTAGAQAVAPTGTDDPRVEAALAQLATDEDKVGQLLLLGWIGTTAEDARAVVRDVRPGGLVFVQNAKTRADATLITAGLGRLADEYGLLRPLLAIDHEGGPVQRIEDVPNRGSNWEFGQGRPTDARACERGREHGQLLRDMGFTMNLAPVLDVNNNPSNPVIGRRSYGDDPELVARLGAAYIRGLQGAGVAAVGKHFPGHGNTSVDSHLALPILPQTVDQLDRLELLPFRRAMDPRTDVAGIMSAHIVFPAVDPSRAPATLSRPIMTGLLRDRLGFRGLSVSDDLGAMKAITDNYTPGEAAARAVAAGVDLLIVSAELPRQRQYRDGLLEGLRSGTLSRERLDEAVRNVLRVKARFGLLGEIAATEAGC